VSRALLALTLASVGFIPPPAIAQTVVVRVLDAETSTPIVGALVSLVDVSGAATITRLTDEQGRALFLGPAPATYRTRSEMIGMATATSDAFQVGPETAAAHVVRLEPRAILLEGLEVSAETRECRVRPAEGLVAARLWDEARKALTAAAVTEEQAFYRYETLRYERDLDGDGRTILTEDRSRRTGYMAAPFESLPAEDLVENGFVQEHGSDLLYYAPDANVLLSDPFLDTHCFRVLDTQDVEGVVGLAFEPSRDRSETSDIAGTLWLDRETAQLRWLDFSYRHLGPDYASANAGGYVEFSRLPAGRWIVPEWWIRMPMLRVEVGVNDRRRAAVTGYRQAGGQVVDVREGGRSLGSGVLTGGIEGVAVDSSGAAVSGVAVGIVGSNQSVFTDVEGRFAISGLGDGVYQLRVTFSDLAQFGYVSPTSTRDVPPGASVWVEIHKPSVAQALGQICDGEARRPGTAILVGSVVDEATGRSVAGARVRVRWSSFQARGDRQQTLRLLEDRTGLETITDQGGSYRFCEVPIGEQLALSVVAEGTELAVETLTIGGGEVGRVRILRHSVR
jgi:hypothetical protein